MYKLFTSSEFTRTIVDSHVREKNSWMKREIPEHVLKSPAVAAERQRRVYIFSVRFVSKPTRVRIPRSNVLFQAANFCQSGRWTLFSVWSHRWVRSIEFLNLFASPCNWSITAWDALKEERPHWRPFQFRSLVKAQGAQRSPGHRLRHPDTAIVVYY